MSFKIAYGAGHNLYTPGRRIPEVFDKNETKEWVLNDRVARYFAEAAAQYEQVQLLRVDDPAGQREVDLSARSMDANNWDADFCLAIHHNGGINLGTGGGIVAYSYPGSTKGAAYRDAIYDACIAAGGLKGNRVSPKLTENFQVLRQTNAPAVLMEYGFMDSATDAPVILTDGYALLVANATMEGIAKVAGLKKKTVPAETDVQLTMKVLEKGSQGEPVKVLQRLLFAMGYSLGSKNPIDGDFGVMTENALLVYQSLEGLPVSGKTDAATWKKLLGA